jgi:DOPA 4,5-dioxygenase
MREASEIQGYHAHVYFDEHTREIAARLREAIGERFTTKLGTWHERKVGPHPQWMYQVAFETAEFAKLVPWLMLNRSGLSILVHPRTGDDVADHDVNPLWLGKALPLDLEFLRRHAH